MEKEDRLFLIGGVNMNFWQIDPLYVGSEFNLQRSKTWTKVFGKEYSN